MQYFKIYLFVALEDKTCMRGLLGEDCHVCVYVFKSWLIKLNDQ